MELAALTRPELIIPNLSGSDGNAVLCELAQLAVDNGITPDGDELYDKLREREELSSTGIGSGVAVPHCKMKRVDKVFVALGRHSTGIDFEAVDGKPVRLFFLVISPIKPPALHLQCLASISRWIKAGQRVEELLELSDAPSMYALLQRAEPSTMGA